MNYKYFLSVLFISLLFLSCEKEKTEVNWSEYYSKGDLTLIAEKYNSDNLNLSIQPPVAWNALNIEMKGTDERTKKRRTNKTNVNSFKVVPDKAFYNNVTRSIFSINKIEFLSEGKSIDIYIKSQINDKDVSSSNQKVFTLKGKQITEIELNLPNLVSTKFLFLNSNNEIVELDFSVRNEKYSAEKEKIRASISSLMHF